MATKQLVPRSDAPVRLRSTIHTVVQGIIDRAGAQGCLPTDPAVLKDMKRRGYVLPEVSP